MKTLARAILASLLLAVYSSAESIQSEIEKLGSPQAAFLFHSLERVIGQEPAKELTKDELKELLGVLERVKPMKETGTWMEGLTRHVVIRFEKGSIIGTIRSAGPESSLTFTDSRLRPIALLPYYEKENKFCLLYTSPSPRDQRGSRMPSSA